MSSDIRRRPSHSTYSCYFGSKMGSLTSGDYAAVRGNLRSWVVRELACMLLHVWWIPST